jgi:hypothetical protein
MQQHGLVLGIEFEGKRKSQKNTYCMIASV